MGDAMLPESPRAHPMLPRLVLDFLLLLGVSAASAAAFDFALTKSVQQERGWSFNVTATR